MQGAKSVWLSPIVEFGVYVINNDSLPPPHMIGRAKALKETSTELRGRLRYAVYDDAIRRQLFRRAFFFCHDMSSYFLMMQIQYYGIW